MVVPLQYFKGSGYPHPFQCSQPFKFNCSDGWVPFCLNLHFPNEQFTFFLFVFVFLESGSFYVAQGCLHLRICLIQTPECWGCWYKPSGLTLDSLFFLAFHIIFIWDAGMGFCCLFSLGCYWV